MIHPPSMQTPPSESGVASQENLPEMSDVMVRSQAFREQRKEDWRELEGIVRLAMRKGTHRLPEHAVHRLPGLYRIALSSLGIARQTMMDQATVRYLESLCASAHIVTHGHNRYGGSDSLIRYLFQVMPTRIRAAFPMVLFSILVTAVAALIAWMLLDSSSAWYSVFIPGDPRNPMTSTEELRASLYGTADFLNGVSFSAFLFTHNAKIAIMCFAVGFALGVPTIYLLFVNGFVLGAFLWLFNSRGLLFEVVGWIAPHGVPELFSIFLAAAAGMTIGRAMLNPGKRSRSQALAEDGRRVAPVAMAAVMLLGYAGVVEGIFRQAVQDDLVRYAVASLHLLVLSGWIVFGRETKVTS